MNLGPLLAKAQDTDYERPRRLFSAASSEAAEVRRLYPLEIHMFIEAQQGGYGLFLQIAGETVTHWWYGPLSERPVVLSEEHLVAE